MGKQIKYIAPVDSVSGMFGKRSHSMSGKAVISNVRTKASQKHPGGHMYFSVLTRTTYKSSEKGLAWQATFTAICVATRERMGNPTFISQDQQAFREQSKYKTLYSYVWNVCRQIIEAGE